MKTNCWPVRWPNCGNKWRKFERAVGRLATIGTLAADELHRLIAQGDSDNVKLGAARAALGFMLQGHESELLAREVAELKIAVEELRNAQQQTGPRPFRDSGSVG
jgi:hypothetical protein